MTRFAATLRAEWTKLATLRSTKPAIALALLVGDALRAILGNGVLLPLLLVIALALDFVLRSTTAVVIGVFALIVAPAFRGGLLPARWQERVLVTCRAPPRTRSPTPHLGRAGGAAPSRRRARGHGVAGGLPWRARGLRWSGATPRGGGTRAFRQDAPER